MSMLESSNVSKLRWQCRRGMLELDLILERLLSQVFPTLNEKQKKTFEQMLAADDLSLHAWLTGAEQPKDSNLKNIVHLCIHYNIK